LKIAEFALERFFARWEFEATHLLCASDVEPVPMAELLALASSEDRARWEHLTLGYTESPGLPELRATISELYEDLEPDDIYTFAGAEEAIFVAMHTLLGPGDHAVVVWPGYQALYEVARSAGAQVTLVALRHDDGWALDLGEVAAAVQSGRTKLVVANFPHSPTGALPTPDEVRALAEIANRAGAVLFLDEVYRFLEYDERDRVPAGAELGGISLGVMSKAFGLAGLRIGWLASRDRELLARCARLKDYTTICNSAPSEVLALIAMRSRGALLDRARSIVATNLELVDGAIAASDRLEWVRPRAGSVGFPRFTDPTMDVDRFAEELVKETGVLILPGSQFQHPGTHFRVGLGRRAVPEALERFTEFATR
jgi:aspartate/methionine/tyrosine aminotransferase